MTKPTKPTVPPAPSRLNPGVDFSNKADAFAAFQTTFADYMDATAEFVDDRADEALAAALAGTLPALTGQAGRFLRVNPGGTAVEFAQVFSLATAVASTSGTAIDFTGIPSWANRVTINFAGVSTNGTSSIIVRIGDAGGIETTGYSDTLGVIEVTAVKTIFSGGSGFTVGDMGVASDAVSGTVTLSRLTGNAWTLAGVLRSQSQRTAFSAGDKTLSDALDRVRITTFNGTDAFDAGTINISWE